MITGMEVLGDVNKTRTVGLVDGGDFSFAYMCNPHLHINEMFTKQVKACLSKTFGDDTNKQINLIMKQPNTRVFALIMIYEQGQNQTEKRFKVLSCVIYTMIDKYVCIDYLCTLKNKLREIKVNHANLNKHEDQDYNNLFGIGIPDILMNIV